MFSEDDLLPISALQHLLYCPRQCALIHVERLWAENALTAQGRHLHEKTDKARPDSRPGLRTARSLMLRSFRLGLFGKSDVVEFRTPTQGGEGSGFGVQQPAARDLSPPSTRHSQLGTPLPFPVEYKRGRPKKHDADRVQLCAQALCLEEMLGLPVPAGALFYGKTRRRLEVPFDPALRALTERTCQRLHEMIRSGLTPRAEYDRNKCDRCSLKNLCLPQSPAGASSYLRRALTHVPASGPAGTD